MKKKIIELTFPFQIERSWLSWQRFAIKYPNFVIVNNIKSFKIYAPKNYNTQIYKKIIELTFPFQIDRSLLSRQRSATELIISLPFLPFSRGYYLITPISRASV